MTLILSLLTRDYVVLASDRRLTWIEQDKSKGKIKITKQEDSDTKTIALHGHFLMGFTGLARLRGYRVERWVADALATVEPNASFTALRDALQDEFRRLGPTERGTPQVFLAIGYARSRETNDLHPMSVVVANGLDRLGHWDPNRSGSRFGISPEYLGNRRQVIRSVGWPIASDLERETLGIVRQIVQRFPDDPLAVFDPLIRCFRMTAEASNRHVGKNVMIATLPRAAVPAPYIVQPLAPGAVDSRRKPLSFYLREEAKRADEAESYSPALITPQLHIIGGMIDPDRLPPPPEGY